MLIRRWAEELDEPVAWTTVERGEHDAQHFWLALIEALSAAAGHQVVERVSPAPSFAGAAVVQRLLTQLRRLDEPLVLVIDDLHELKSEDALSWLEVLLARLPRQLRVVLGTREEPGLGLHRLRLAGELTEVRGPDLPFSLEETRALLAGSGITLSDAGIARLHERTEGWPAGLRLAVISLAHHPDPERFVSEFSGSERTVARYLVAEVLERQPPNVREFLLRTAILERVSGGLADALTGGAGGEAVLQRLEDENAFVTALDAGRTWFRYHHLFADLLRLELRRTAPATIPVLHRIAAGWHEREGDVIKAVGHYQDGGDWAPAGRLLADHYLSLTMAGRGQTLHALLQMFPAAAELHDANISCALAVDSILYGLLDEAKTRLDLARRIAATAPFERRRLLQVYLAVIALEIARRRSDLAEAQAAMHGLQAAFDTPPAESQLPVRPEYVALALMNLGIVELWAGQPEAARQHLAEALHRTRRISRPFIEVGCLAHLSMAALLTGDPMTRALELSEQAVAIAEEHGWTSESMTTGAFAMAGMAFVWLGLPAEADRHLERAEACLRAAADPGTELALRHARGLLHFGQGRLDRALAEFEDAQRGQRLLAGQHVLAAEVHGRALQVRVRMGDGESAGVALARLSPEEREHAPMRIARGALDLDSDHPEHALDVLAGVIDGTAPALFRRWARIEALLLAATARDRLGDRSGAHTSLEAALELVEPEGLILPFMLWPCRDLLERHPRHQTAHATLVSTTLDILAGRAAPQRGPLAASHDDLSDAELRVLRYLPSNLTASEMASELMVSTNTVRTHMRHIYAKLGAHTRGEVVARARELGLVGPGALRR